MNFNGKKEEKGSNIYFSFVQHTCCRSRVAFVLMHFLIWAFSDSFGEVLGSTATSGCATECFSPHVAPEWNGVVAVWCEKEHNTKWHMMSF